MKITHTSSNSWLWEIILWNLNFINTVFLFWCKTWWCGGDAASAVNVAIIPFVLQYYSQSSKIKATEEEELVINLAQASVISIIIQSSAVKTRY